MFIPISTQKHTHPFDRLIVLQEFLNGGPRLQVEPFLNEIQPCLYKTQWFSQNKPLNVSQISLAKLGLGCIPLCKCIRELSAYWNEFGIMTSYCLCNIYTK